VRLLLDEGAQARLKELAAARPHATIAELREAFVSETGRTDSARRLGRELKKLGIRRVRVPPAPGAATPPKPRRYGYTARHRWTGGPGAYPSNLTDAEWELVADIFEKRGPGRPERYSRRQMVDAIVYVQRSGCAWRMLPHDFPRWQNVYRTLRRWTAKGLFKLMHERLRTRCRERQGRDASPTVGVIDSQSVKTSEKGGPRGTTVRRRSRDASATS
jgi:transposase